jgi:2-dehydro-3-deoxyphosphogluconate aldolase / (4S)-4-hydroxy-2-oxoglutarate aldolase
MTKAEVRATILDQRVIAIVRAAAAEDAHQAVTALLRAGLRAVEVSLVTPGALDVIREVAGAGHPGAHIGVGTVLRAHEVGEAARAGAEFVVSPTLDAEVVGATTALGLLSIPGVLTPSEAVRATHLGADLVKLFPASAWSPGVMRDVLAALPVLAFVPTGGISLDDAPTWVSAGAVAVGMGSALTRGAPGDVFARAAGLLARLKAAGAH